MEGVPSVFAALMILRTLLVFLLLAAPLPSFANNWALGGMDAVAYRSQGAAVAGRSDLVTQWAGQNWHFSTEANRAAFEANPRAFAPGFGGLCPVSLAEGRPQPGDPRHFAIIGERLYLARSAAARQQLLAAPRDILMKAKGAFVALGN